MINAFQQEVTLKPNWDMNGITKPCNGPTEKQINGENNISVTFSSANSCNGISGKQIKE